MRKLFNLKHVALLLALLMPTAWCGANGISALDGFSHILIKD